MKFLHPVPSSYTTGDISFKYDTCLFTPFLYIFILMTFNCNSTSALTFDTHPTCDLVLDMLQNEAFLLWNELHLDVVKLTELVKLVPEDVGRAVSAYLHAHGLQVGQVTQARLGQLWQGQGEVESIGRNRTQSRQKQLVYCLKINSKTGQSFCLDASVFKDLGATLVIWLLLFETA